jgi:hypothetical protein
MPVSLANRTGAAAAVPASRGEVVGGGVRGLGHCGAGRQDRDLRHIKQMSSQIRSDHGYCPTNFHTATVLLFVLANATRSHSVNRAHEIGLGNVKATREPTRD